MIQRQPESVYLYHAEPETCYQSTSYTCSQQQGSYHQNPYHQMAAVQQQDQQQQQQYQLMANNHASLSEIQSDQLTAVMSRQYQQQQQQVKYDQSHGETVAISASTNVPASLANNDLIYKQQQQQQQQQAQCSASLLTSTPTLSAPSSSSEISPSSSSSSSTSLLAHKASSSAHYNSNRRQLVSPTSPTTSSLFSSSSASSSSSMPQDSHSKAVICSPMQNQQQLQVQTPQHATFNSWPMDGAIVANNISSGSSSSSMTQVIQSNSLPPTHWPHSSPITYVKTPPVNSGMALACLSPDVGSPPTACDDLLIMTPPSNNSTSSGYIGQQPVMVASNQQHMNRTILLSSSVSPPIGLSGASSISAQSIGEGCGSGGGGGGSRSVASPSGASSTISSIDSTANNLSINLEQYISKRNERERSRVRNVNDAFDNLKNSLPLEVEKLTKRMSKVEILRTAISYIKNLEDVLGYRQHHNYNDPHRHLGHQHNHNCTDRALMQQQQQSCAKTHVPLIDRRARSGSFGSHMRRPEVGGRAIWTSSANRGVRGKSYLSVRKLNENSSNSNGANNVDEKDGRIVGYGHYWSVAASQRRAAPGFRSSSSSSSLLSLNRCDIATMSDCASASTSDALVRKSMLLKRNDDDNDDSGDHCNEPLGYSNRIKQEQRMASAIRDMSACCMDEPSPMKRKIVEQQHQQENHSMDESSQEQQAYEEFINGFRCYSDDQLDDY